MQLQCMNKKKSFTEFPSHFELNGTNIVNKQTIADEFNNFFVKVGPNLAKNIPAVNNAASIYDYMGQQNLNSMFISPVNEAEVIRIIKLCKPKDSMDYDDISMWVLSRIAPHVIKPLVHISNLSFSTEMKIAKVIPLFKNGRNRTSLTIVQFHFYHSSLRYWKIIQRATTTILEYK